MNILPSDVRYLDPGRITVCLAVNTSCDVDRLVDIGELDVTEGHILHMAVARISLDPCCVAAVCEVDILEYHVVDVIWLGSILSHTANAHPPR